MAGRRKDPSVRATATGIGYRRWKAGLVLLVEGVAPAQLGEDLRPWVEEQAARRPAAAYNVIHQIPAVVWRLWGVPRRNLKSFGWGSALRAAEQTQKDPGEQAKVVHWSGRLGGMATVNLCSSCYCFVVEVEHFCFAKLAEVQPGVSWAYSVP